MENLEHEKFMREALRLAQRAQSQYEVPVGAVIVHDGKIIARGYNSPILSCDPTQHAEISALRKASKKYQNYRLPGMVLYVTLEPCLMCLGAILHARISHIIFGASDPKLGAVRHVAHKTKYTSGILEAECSTLLKQFFKPKR